MASPRIQLVVGYTAARAPQCLYCGVSGDEARAVFADPGEGIVQVELFRFPLASSRRSIVASPSGVESKHPQDANPAEAAAPTDLPVHAEGGSGPVPEPSDEDAEQPTGPSLDTVAGRKRK